MANLFEEIMELINDFAAIDEGENYVNTRRDFLLNLEEKLNELEAEMV